MILCFRCLNAWNEEYNHKHLFWTTKNRVWRCFIFCSELFSVHLLLFFMFLFFTGFNWRVQIHSSEIFRSFYVSFVDIIFFLLSQANRYGSLCFLLRSKWFLPSSYVSCVLILEMESTTTNICGKLQTTQSGDALYFFPTFLLFIMFLLFKGFNWRVQTHASKIFRSSYVSFVEIFFFCFLKRTGMVLYVFFRCKWFLASSYVSGVLIL